jgi:signal transduction histidine kinase
MTAVNLLPQSMFGRLLASLLVAIGVTLIAIVLLVLQDRRELALRVGGVGDTSRRVADIANSLATMDRLARARALEEMARTPTFIIDPDRPEPRPPPLARDLATLERSFASQVGEHLGGSYRVSVSEARPDARNVIRLIAGGGPHEPFGPPPPRPEGSPPPHPRAGPPGSLLDIRVGLPDGGDVVFRVSPPRPGPPLPVQLFIELGILTLVLGIVLFLVTRNITRPLSQLASAADAVGRSMHHPPLPERGVREIRNATRAFNTMQDRLLRYLDSRTRVLAAMSHDLRTPLTRLRLRIEAIDETRQRDRYAADLDEMENLVEGALGLFKGFEDTEGFEPTDIDALVQTLRKEFSEIGASVSIEGSALRPMNAKPRALKRALSNLIGNAVKFGTRAMIRIDDGEALVIRVSDDGPGIPDANLEQVFEPFFRLEASRNRDTGGTGLGLTIAREIIQAHGGTVVLRNLPERGIEATVMFPRG